MEVMLDRIRPLNEIPFILAIEIEPQVLIDNRTLRMFKSVFSGGFRLLGVRHMSTPSRLEKCLNSVTLMGRTGAAPQMRGSDAHPVVNFSLATHNFQKLESGDTQQKTEWHRVAVFRPHLRDLVHRYLGKGQRVLVQGRLMYGEITDAQGVQRQTTTIVADEVIFLTKTEGDKAEDYMEA
ncbi:unnamed protein product [Notodromas monacha]|uniref:Single-stranded DNA-binding protein, mitochondrial n=1 Tax=Notodromas monacha TaxID=399045 RepID=A0A7R9BJV9_9CRUS|nr:unnamed protein product [Notodromas monacha]CAG0916854.1 unnamed protein product [Notodromas monacha]